MSLLIWKTNLAKKLSKFSKSLEDLESFLDDNVDHHEMPEVGVSEAKKAFCPLIGRNCVEVDCGRCSTLDLEFPEKVWICSDCADLEGFKLYPFWHDGKCTCCDEYSIVLCMATLLPDDPD